MFRTDEGEQEQAREEGYDSLEDENVQEKLVGEAEGEEEAGVN